MTRKVILVGSGKGGVGKSTVSVNTAIALSHEGAKVGVLDADIWGPSIPVMLGLRRMTPQKQGDKILPFEKFGIKAMSMGNVLQEAEAGVWRGPVLHTLIQKLFNEIEWGELDFLIVDLPPGTGDVPISISQIVEVAGAVIVTTPQEVAVVDAMKAINAFDQLEIPLLGIVENMAGFTPPGASVRYDIFGSSRGALLAERFGTTLLGTLPYLPQLQLGSDEGVPSSFVSGSDSTLPLFKPIGKQLMRSL